MEVPVSDRTCHRCMDWGGGGGYDYASSLILLLHECVVFTFSTQEILGAIHASQCECVGVMYVYMYLMALIG